MLYPLSGNLKQISPSRNALKDWEKVHAYFQHYHKLYSWLGGQADLENVSRIILFLSAYIYSMKRCAERSKSIFCPDLDKLYKIIG